MPIPTDETELASEMPPPGLREAVVSEGRRRLRARRRTAEALVVLGVVALCAVAVLPGGRSSDERVRAGGRPETTTSLPRADASPVPAHLVAATTGGTGRPGDIQLLSGTDGSVIRTLAQAWGPYPANGLTLSPDGQSAYFVRLLEAEQRFEIASVSTQGGPIEHVAFGRRPTLDPSGRKMAYVSERGESLVVLDMASRRERRLDPTDLPDDAKGEVIASLQALVWVDDSRLAVLTSTPPNAPRYGRLCSPMAPCPTTTTTPPTTPTSHVLVFEPDAVTLAEAQVHSAPVGTEWTFVARGLDPGTLVVAGVPIAPQDATETSISMVDVDLQGRPPRSLVPLPEFSTPLSVDRSGQHLLYKGQGGLFRRSIVGEAAPVRFEGEYLSASW